MMTGAVDIVVAVPDVVVVAAADQCSLDHLRSPSCSQTTKTMTMIAAVAVDFVV